MHIRRSFSQYTKKYDTHVQVVPLATDQAIEVRELT